MLGWTFCGYFYSCLIVVWLYNRHQLATQQVEHKLSEVISTIQIANSKIIVAWLMLDRKTTQRIHMIAQAQIWLVVNIVLFLTYSDSIIWTFQKCYKLNERLNRLQRNTVISQLLWQWNTFCNLNYIEICHNFL